MWCHQKTSVNIRCVIGMHTSTRGLGKNQKMGIIAAFFVRQIAFQKEYREKGDLFR